MSTSIERRLDALESARSNEPIGQLVFARVGESGADARKRCNIKGDAKSVVILPGRASGASSK